eukprot:scaffold140040_cov17-Tisochrysis_lutea.AAC.1
MEPTLVLLPSLAACCISSVSPVMRIRVLAPTIPASSGHKTRAPSIKGAAALSKPKLETAHSIQTRGRYRIRLTGPISTGTSPQQNFRRRVITS